MTILNPESQLARTLNGMSEAGQRYYDDDEAEQILRVAAAIASSEGKITFERLIETAAELGISPEAVAQAEKQVVERRETEHLQGEFDAFVRRRFFALLTSYLVTCTVLALINVFTSPHYLWFFWPLLGWGIGIIPLAATTFIRQSESYHRDFAKWKAARESNAELPEPNYRVHEFSPGLTVGLHVGQLDRREKRQREARRSNRRQF